MTSPTTPANSPAKLPQPAQGRVTEVVEIAGDTRIYRVKMAAAVNHRAGQYALLQDEGFAPREFSIASTPESGILEFHIKSTGRGGLSDHIFKSWKAGSDITVTAPLGDHYWRPSSRPLLALAGGVGIAPLKAIIEAHIAYAKHAPVHLYWGVRDSTHLYLDKFFRELAAGHPEFHFVPLLAQKETGSPYRSGYIAPALAADFKTLAGFNIYLAGPKAMVEATLPVLTEKGAEKEWLFSDAFGP